MATLSYSERALLDLVRLPEFAVENGAGEAHRTVGLVMAAAGMLADHPAVGRVVDGYLSELIISRGSTGCVALYRVDDEEDAVRILSIRHQREAGF